MFFIFKIMLTFLLGELEADGEWETFLAAVELLLLLPLLLVVPPPVPESFLLDILMTLFLS